MPGTRVSTNSTRILTSSRQGACNSSFAGCNHVSGCFYSFTTHEWCWFPCCYLDPGSALTAHLPKKVKASGKRGFQELKMMRSGHEALIQRHRNTIPDTFIGLPTIIGGFVKTADPVLRIVLDFIRSHNTPLSCVDDRIRNLAGVQNFFQENGINPLLYLIQRETVGVAMGSMPEGILQINSLAEIDIVPRVLYMLDLDGTCIDTKRIRGNWEKRLKDLRAFHQSMS